MRSLRALAETASDLSVPLSLVLKSDLGREVLGSTSRVAGLVLQGGGALHHVFGSPRFSADLDFAQQPDLDEAALAAALSHAAAEAPDVGRLHAGSGALQGAVAPSEAEGRDRRRDLPRARHREIRGPGSRARDSAGPGVLGVGAGRVSRGCEHYEVTR